MLLGKVEEPSRSKQRILLVCQCGSIVQFRIRRGRWMEALKTYLLILASTYSEIFTNTGGEKVPELKFKTVDTVVHGSSSDWNLRIYLPANSV